MAKKKNSSRQEYMPDSVYIRKKVRSLPIGKCYVTEDILETGEGHVVVTRLHAGGKVSLGMFLVDTSCLGVKDSFWRLRMEQSDVEKMLFGQDRCRFKEIGYNEAHNIIYGAIAYAEEMGIEPDPSFKETSYFLEDDTEDIPLIEYHFGKDRKRLFFAMSRKDVERYLPVLAKACGGRLDHDKVEYIIPAEFLREEDQKFL